MRPRLDPELGVAKKDDDLYVKSGRTGWRARGNPRVPPRKTFKRLALALLLSLVVYVFVHNIPTDLGPRDTRHPIYTHPSADTPSDSAPKFNSPIPTTPNEGHSQGSPPAHDYDGPLRFLELAESLRSIGGTGGSSPVNKNVLFMASALKSASRLLPIACQMGREARSNVHFALVSRNEIPMEQLRDLNGIDKGCSIVFHDARSEFSSRSSDGRFERTVGRALHHINNYMHPQAVIVDSEAEEVLFLRAGREQAAKMGLQAPIIELPAGAEERLSWLTKLDAGSLLQWNRISVDILIYAHAEASGSLIRLLKSLSEADYTQCAVPHLTIELPEQIDLGFRQYLQDFRWPPRSARYPAGSNLLTLRHRISGRGTSEEESSVGFLEGFWPANPLYSHVLVLSSQVELSPNFFHYLKMSLLEYRYSAQAIGQGWGKKMLGISLALPTTTITDSTPFTPPTEGSEETERPDTRGATRAPTSFLWQAPNSNAVLFMGEKWAELHDFVSQSLEAQHAAASPLALLSEKLVSKKSPAWLEHVLRLCRARGYWTMYPGPRLAPNLAIVHKELHRQPEDYGDRVRFHDGDEIIMHRGSLLGILEDDGGLPRFRVMPLLTWNGTKATAQELGDDAVAYAARFRSEVGGCMESKTPPTAGSLFCKDDDVIAKI